MTADCEGVPGRARELEGVADRSAGTTVGGGRAVSENSLCAGVTGRRCFEGVRWAGREGSSKFSLRLAVRV